MDNQNEIKAITKKLRQRLTEFRYQFINEESSIHINSVEIALGLIEFAIKVNREIRADEEQWFKGGKYIDLIVGNSEWKDISDLYYEMIRTGQKCKYLSKSVP